MCRQSCLSAVLLEWRKIHTSTLWKSGRAEAYVSRGDDEDDQYDGFGDLLEALRLEAIGVHIVVDAEDT